MRGIGQLGLNAGAAGQVLAAGQAFQASFMGSRWRMSVTQMVAETTLVLSVPPTLSRSISLRICWVWPLGVLLDVVGDNAGGEHEAVGLDDLGIDLRRLVPLDGHGVPPLGVALNAVGHSMGQAIDNGKVRARPGLTFVSAAQHERQPCLGGYRRRAPPSS